MILSPLKVAADLEGELANLSVTLRERERELVSMREATQAQTEQAKFALKVSGHLQWGEDQG